MKLIKTLKDWLWPAAQTPLPVSLELPESAPSPAQSPDPADGAARLPCVVPSCNLPGCNGAIEAPVCAVHWACLPEQVRKGPLPHDDCSKAEVNVAVAAWKHSYLRSLTALCYRAIKYRKN